MKTANPTTIEITDLVKDIKGKRIIDHVNLHLESGKITGLKGVNGSGKTMLMRLVCGLWEHCHQRQASGQGHHLSGERGHPH